MSTGMFASLRRSGSATEIRIDAYRPQLAAEGVAVALSARDEERLRHWLERAVKHKQAGDTSTSPAEYRARLMELTDELRACAAAARQ